MSKLRFGSWTAVSSLQQAEKISLEDQRERNHRYIEQQGGVLVAEMQVKESRDIVEISEAADRIPAYHQLRELIRSNAIDVLVCYTRSRLGRTLALVETIAELCRRANIIIVETDSPPPSLQLDPNPDADLLTGAVRSWSAQREIAELRRRRAMGMAGRLKRGEFMAAVPWGWCVRHDENSGERTIIIDQEAAETIRMMLIELYLERGLGGVVIARILNEAGRYGPNGLPWTKVSVADMFRLVYRYAGYVEYNGRVKHNKAKPYMRAVGKWPKIITEDELQRLLQERKSRRGKRGEEMAVYRFSLMIWCVRCQKRMYMNTQKTSFKRLDGGTSHYETPVAYCAERPYHADRFITIKKVLNKVREFFIYLQDEANWGPYLVNTGPDPAALEGKIDELNAKIRDLEARIYIVDDKLIDGTLDTDRHAYQIRRLKESIERLEAEITEINEQKAQIVTVADRRRRLEQIALHGLSYLEMDDQRAANAKLRPLIRIWMLGREVSEIEIL